MLPAEVSAPDVAVIGGSGFYHFLDQAHEVSVDTPFGAPSAAITVGQLDGRNVAFLPRHGAKHELPPHRIPYRANLWALQSLGVRQILAPCAVGSLSHDLGPGALVIPDQLLDRTRGRRHTFYEVGAGHVGFADPYCPTGRGVALAAAQAAGWAATPTGTMAVIDGPRFATRAESRELANAGASLINMTGMPEASLARELALCYTSIALVTDRDAGIDEGDGVSQAEVFALFARYTEELKSLVRGALGRLPSGPSERDCPCAHALEGITATPTPGAT